MKNLLDFSFPDSSWSRYQLDREAYLVFLALQQQPTMPVSQLADRLQFSTTLVNSRLAYLKNQGFLRPDREILVPFLGRRLQTEVEAIYDYHSLGLIRYHVFFEDMDSFQQVQYLEQFLAIHPFTHYHVVTYSPSLTIYVQFDIPSQASSFVDKLCHILQEMGIIGSFHSFNETVVATSETDFSKWRVRTNTWELLDSQGFNPKSLVSDLDILWDEFLNNQDSFATPVTTMSSWSFNFDDIDMQLLRELTVNGKPVVTDLAKHYKISRSRLSRRLSRLKENVIRGIALSMIHWCLS